MPATRSLHPSADQLRAFAQGRLPRGNGRAESHVAYCDSCCRHLARVPDDTLVQLAREAATQGTFASQAHVAARPRSRQSRRDSARSLRDHPRYRVLGLVGHGGMGAVYKAEHRLMERLVALKVISPALLANPQAVERFRREVRGGRPARRTRTSSPPTTPSRPATCTSW